MSFIGGSSVNVTIDLSNVPNELPSQTGQAGKALVTNGSSVSWASAGTSLPTDGSTSVAYTTTNTTAGRTYGFKLESNTCGIAEVPYITTSDDTGARGVHVGYKHEQAAYGGGSVSVGYEALLPGFGVTTTTANAERTVAIGYQAGYNAHATTSSIFIGSYQGYAVSAARQLRIGNSGTPHPNSGYDKALLEGTFGTTDATQTFKINADAVYLGLAIPTTQPSDTRLWLNNGSLSIGAPSGGGGLSFTPAPIPLAKRTGNRTSTITISQSGTGQADRNDSLVNYPNRLINGLHTLGGSNENSASNEDYDTSNYGVNWNQNGYYHFDFGSGNAYAINEIVMYWSTQGTNYWGYSNADKLDDILIRAYGSNDNSSWSNLNDEETSFYSQVHTGAWNYHESYKQFNVICGRFYLYSNMNNFRYYKLVMENGALPSGNIVSEFEFQYRKRHEADYT